jgi:hypothetical protein
MEAETHAFVAKVLVNAVTGDVKSSQNHMYDNPTNHPSGTAEMSEHDEKRKATCFSLARVRWDNPLNGRDALRQDHEVRTILG